MAPNHEYSRNIDKVYSSVWQFGLRLKMCKGLSMQEIKEVTFPRPKEMPCTICMLMLPTSTADFCGNRASLSFLLTQTDEKCASTSNTESSLIT